MIPTSFAVLVGLLPSLAPRKLACRPESPVVPRPTSLAASSTFGDATARLEEAFNSALSRESTAGWDVHNTSFSLALVSHDQPDPATPVWEFHHLAEGNVAGTKSLDRHSQYLIGSVTKALSNYILLESGVDLDAPVTDFVPALATDNSTIQWREVTLRALAEHLSGTPQNFGFSEYYYLKDVLQSLGFPDVGDDQYPKCGVIALNDACTPQQLVDGLAHGLDVTAPMERPAYSNIAFSVMMLALQEQMGKNYTQLVRDVITVPLDMPNTMVSPGQDEKAVIPPVENSWGSDYRVNAPGGGVVSSLADLSTFAHGILGRTILPTPGQVRQWLKPTSFAGSLYSFVGAPWEIFRPTPSALTPDHPHPITIYAKSGGANGYRAQFVIVDEYGVGIVVLAAGDVGAASYIYDAVLSVLIEAVDKVSREQASQTVSGDYSVASCSGDDAQCVSLIIDQDDDSLFVANLIRSNTDVLEGIHAIYAQATGIYFGGVEKTFRLFPTEIRANATMEDGTAVVREDWRMWPQTVYETDSDLPGRGLGALDCISWTFGDWVHYASEPVGRVVIIRQQKDGQVVGAEVPFLRSGELLKQ